MIPRGQVVAAITRAHDNAAALATLQVFLQHAQYLEDVMDTPVSGEIDAALAVVKGIKQRPRSKVVGVRDAEQLALEAGINRAVELTSMASPEQIRDAVYLQMTAVREVQAPH